jgi:toxin ParE1/3/4
VRLRYTRTATLQIEHTLDYIHERSPQGLVTIRNRIQRAFALLEQHPLSGQETDREGVFRLVLTPYPYVIFYRIRNHEIIILRFRHAARKPLP